TSDVCLVNDDCGDGRSCTLPTQKWCRLGSRCSISLAVCKLDEQCPDVAGAKQFCTPSDGTRTCINDPGQPCNADGDCTTPPCGPLKPVACATDSDCRTDALCPGYGEDPTPCTCEPLTVKLYAYSGGDRAFTNPLSDP